MPKISVIVPVYKVEKYLDRCVRSVLAQTFRDFELILVDDGSPDSCPQMCDDWAKKDSRIRVIHQNNQGLSAARNTGIRAASGEYINFIDSDDWVSATMLSDLYRLLIKYDADISVCGFEKCSSEKQQSDSGRLCGCCRSRDEFMDIILKIKSNRTIHYAWGKLYKRNILDSEHFPVGMLNEDVEGTFKAVMRSKRIAETPKADYFYFINTQSITGERFGKNYLCLNDVWKRVQDISEKDAPKYYDKVCFNVMRMDFTILTQSILHGDSETDKLYKNELDICLKRLRKNTRKLLSGPMVIKRKLALLAVSLFYYPIRRCFRTIKNQVI